MHISWLGGTCVKLQTKYIDEDVVVLIDAYKPKTGEFPRSFSPTIALFSNGAENAATLSQNPFLLDTLGECELKDVMITAFPITETGTSIFKINSEQINIVHLGRLSKKPDLATLEKIGAIDVLLLPVGAGKEYLSVEDAATIVTALEPRVVIPMGYNSDTDPDAEPLTAFLKESGLKPKTTDKKIILKKKDLPQEDMELIVLEKSV